MPSTNSAETLNQEFVSVKRSKSANGAQLTKLYNELEKSMMSYNNIEEVKLLKNKLCERFEHFKSVHLQCLDLCAQPEVVADLEANFESCLKNFEEFRERFSQWIAGAIGPQDGENIPLENDAESNVSHGSSRTSVSSRRKLQSAKAKRLIAEHKLKQLKKKQELERTRRDLEMKQQLLDQQSELEEAEIEEMVWLETTQEETGVISNNQNAQPDVQNNMTNHIQVNNRTDSVRNITLTQPRPEINRSCIPEVDSETSNIDRSFQRLASALHEGFNLPKPELLTFDGKPEGYCKFIKNFETNIESRISDNNLKLSYLIQYCTGNCAELSLCNKFKSMSLNDRYKLVRSLKLCYNCLKGKHFTNKCRKPKICNVTNCNVKHHILLHSWVKPDNGHTAVQSSCNCAATEGSTVKNCLGIIPVIVRGGDGSSCQTYALLDDGADKTLCDERLLRSLNITGKPVTFRMSTANSREGIIHGQEADLDIQPIDGNESITLRKVWSVKSLPISTRSAAKYADIRNLPYLSGINIPDIDTNDVMMLIGTDSPVAHIPLEVKFGNSDEPYAIRTRLGWAIRGPVPTTQESNDININFFESRDMLLQQQIERLWTTDFNDKSQVKSCMSVEDKSAMKFMESTLTREDGHYKLGLPWRDRNSSFVNNIPLAQDRLQQLKCKLSSDHYLHDMYRTTVNGYIANGYSSDVDHMVPEKMRVWYTPHHPETNVYNVSETDKLDVWQHGPTFHGIGREHWPKYSGNIIPEVIKDDVEVKREIAVNVTTCDTIGKIIEHYSDWFKLRSAVAWFLRYKDYCKQRYLHHDVVVEKGNLTLSELKTSSSAVVKYVQMECFADELINLQKGTNVKGESPIASLNPILKDGLIRTKGRIIYHDETKCPIILPKRHHLTTLMIRFSHESQGHVGVQQVLAATRTRYWIINGHSAVKQVVRNCVPCKRKNNPLCKQQMGPLLDEQITPDKPPFSFIGIDFFGPLMVKSGKSQVKRYGCIFSCLTSRAVHLEVTHSLSTDSFIAALQRFISRRGLPEKVYSDNGTNLVSGDCELRKSIREWNQSEIGQYMLQREMEWNFNPPSASHMGGIWERMIRSTRAILRSLVKEQLLTDEQLLTVVTEVEKILNDRPITRVSDDPKDLPALTPSMILLLKSNTCIPGGIFRKEDTYAKRRWRQAQYLADIFWKRWIREYIPTLQSRQKWLRPQRDIREGDIVLVAQENIPRGQWPLAGL
ncbi:uncharacterized protein LOC132740165 [Ruditapes philippinarum]|uniref:uncharacterized protein LOC132740165 n=1 Tax=Ruditapes philippinarum TaxID=129788 RepID=UPI00295B26A9|nr:uncharacterized protein LOC132740165 [Ruditapes philippinarum]